jgi:hypothetical protein
MRKKSPAGSGLDRVLVIALIAVLLAAGFPSTAAAKTAVYRISTTGLNVTANFDGNDECGATYAYVFASNGTYKDSVTGKTGTSLASLSIYRYDYCLGSYFSGYGQVDLSNGQLTVANQLGLATLQANVPVSDYYTGSTVTFSLALTWTATAGSVTSKSKSSATYEDGTKISYQSSGTSRQASASGSILAETINFSASPSNYALIDSTKFGYFQLSKP